MEEKRKKPDAATVVKAVNAAVLCLLGLGISAYLLLAPRPTQSGIENRELAKFPEFSWESYFNAEYTAGITEYFTDTAPGRDTYKNIITDIRALFGITPKEGVIGVQAERPRRRRTADRRGFRPAGQPLTNKRKFQRKDAPQQAPARNRYAKNEKTRFPAPAHQPYAVCGLSRMRQQRRRRLCRRLGGQFPVRRLCFDGRKLAPHRRAERRPRCFRR